MKKRVTLLLAIVLLICAVAPALAEGITIISAGSSSTSPYGGEIELKPGDIIKVDGDYSITLSAAHCLSKDSNLSGKYIAYLTTKEDGSPYASLRAPAGTHTLLRIYINLTNRSNEETNWLRRVKCDVVYDELYTFETLAVQYNPNQTGADGETGYSSIEARPTEALMSVQVSFFTAVPYIVRDSDKSLWAYITLDDDVYSVNLREVLVLD